MINRVNNLPAVAAAFHVSTGKSINASRQSAPINRQKPTQGHGLVNGSQAIRSYYLPLVFAGGKKLTPVVPSDPKLKPMLAKEVDLKSLRYPVMVSPKLDGFRALIDKDRVLTRGLYLLPNQEAHHLLAPFHGLDGELISGSPTKGQVFNRTSSHMTSRDTTGEFTFYVFDRWDMKDKPYRERYQSLLQMAGQFPAFIKVVPQTVVHNEEELLVLEKRLLKQGYEGAMIRDMEAPYKYGRSTQKEGILLKLKRFKDAEAKIVGFVLSSSKRNAGGLKEFILEDIKTGVRLKIGNGRGLTVALRREIWQNQAQYLGQIVKYKHFAYGEKDKPRKATLIGFRHHTDMSSDE